MKIYKCVECGYIFNEGDEAEWTEMHGFTYGAGESWSGCPICRGGYEEVFECAECGEWFWFFRDELNEDGICEECQEEEE